MLNQDPAERIIGLRKKLSLTQREMSKEFGVSPGALAMWEKRMRPIPGMALKMLEIYEEALDEEIKLKNHQEILRDLASSWSQRLALVWAKGARGPEKSSIKRSLNTTLQGILIHELSSDRFKRSFQIALYEKFIDAAVQTKGAPLKFAQMLTFIKPDLHPDMRQALEGIYTLQYPMAPTVVAKIVAEELGASPHKIFAEWESLPIASASIGQVHRARLKTGELVAVKVQYPAIAESLEKDLAFFDLIGKISTFFSDEIKELLSEVSRVVMDELDYLQEMQNLEEFRRLCEGEKRIVIPRVYRELSSQRVITMDYLEGKSLKEFKNSNEAERKLAVETIARFSTLSTFKYFKMYTDTHAGNFVFLSDGKVGFLDFGRCVSLHSAQTDSLRKFLVAVINQDKELARKLVPDLAIIKDQGNFDFESFWGFFQNQQRHLWSGEFHFTHQYVHQTLQAIQAYKGKKELVLTMDTIWSTAISLGLWNVFAELDVKVNYGKISLEVFEDLSL